jgi:preprotein translocase subunit SecY
VLSNLKNVFKVPDLRNKILFTFFIVALYRLGVAIRVPGIDADAVTQFQQAVKSQGALGFLDLFSAAPSAASRSSRSASCRTSPPASSCRCSAW